jgi:N-acylneuraminate cytidylyltransferase/CMP-N,N'-diacetyllegionaminic acid synthase
MIEDKRVLGLIPARRGSKGLPLKNIRPLGGKPLLAWPVAAALGSAYVDRVVVSTDDEEFAAIARTAGAETPFLRPAELASDTAPSMAFILHALDALATGGDVFDYVVLLEPTSPLTESCDVDAALERLLARRAYADSIVGVSLLQTSHPAFAVRMAGDGTISPASAPTFGDLPRRQDLESMYALDGSLYISTVQALRQRNGFCHERTLGHPMPRYKSLEIDDLLDFVCIQAILDKLQLVRDAEAR